MTLTKILIEQGKNEAGKDNSDGVLALYMKSVTRQGKGDTDRDRDRSASRLREALVGRVQLYRPASLVMDGPGRMAHIGVPIRRRCAWF